MATDIWKGGHTPMMWKEIQKGLQVFSGPDTEGPGSAADPALRGRLYRVDAGAFSILLGAPTETQLAELGDHLKPAFV